MEDELAEREDDEEGKDDNDAVDLDCEREED